MDSKEELERLFENSSKPTVCHSSVSNRWLLAAILFPSLAHFAAGPPARRSLSLMVHPCSSARHRNVFRSLIGSPSCNLWTCRDSNPGPRSSVKAFFTCVAGLPSRRGLSASQLAWVTSLVLVQGYRQAPQFCLDQLVWVDAGMSYSSSSLSRQLTPRWRKQCRYRWQLRFARLIKAGRALPARRPLLPSTSKPIRPVDGETLQSKPYQFASFTFTSGDGHSASSGTSFRMAGPPRWRPPNFWARVPSRSIFPNLAACCL